MAAFRARFQQNQDLNARIDAERQRMTDELHSEADVAELWAVVPRLDGVRLHIRSPGSHITEADAELTAKLADNCCR